MRTFLHRPRAVFARRVFFRVHLWTGILAGAYIFIVCLTGAALVFRLELQKALHPALFRATTGTQADAATILELVQGAFPDDRVSGVDAPTAARPTYLAYLLRGDRFVTLLVDPGAARVLGELPDHALVRTMQDLHFDLLAGRRGRLVNGTGALLLLILCATGIVIWWPGAAHWRRGFDLRGGLRRTAWTLHATTGILTVAFVAMWAITGASFAFPSAFRRLVSGLSPVTVATTPDSDVRAAWMAKRPSWRDLIGAAQKRMPGFHVARVVMPATDRAPLLVLFSPVTPSPANGAGLIPLYVDRYTGKPLEGALRRRSIGDVVLASVAPLHMGSFGGTAIKVLWVAVGVSPPFLFATGFFMWWCRVVRPTMSRTLPPGGRVPARLEP